MPSGLPPQRPVDHAIETDPEASPPHRALFQLSPSELDATREYVTDLLRLGKIRPSSSPYGAPLFFVKQKGSLRGVIDYRALNRITKPNHAPIPRTDEMFDRLGSATVFSKLDLKLGLHQIRVRESDVEKTSFKTKYGLFEFMVMAMGLRNAPATFQSLMNSIFSDCIDRFMIVYLDDLLIYSNSPEDHLIHLETVLSRLQKHDLYVNITKCDIASSDTEFLGLNVGIKGVSISLDRKKVVADWPTPKSLTELRSFLGLLQFFRRFIRNFSHLAAPLTDLTRKGFGINNWNKSCDTAFAMLKEKLCSAPIMQLPDWNRPFRCHTDASGFAVGGSLGQLNEYGDEVVVAHFFKRLSPAEENYTANDRELSGLIYFLQRFRCYLEGSEFEAFTDNQVLKAFFTKTSMTRREARWLDFLSQFNITAITLRKGRIHVLGDALSRAPHAPVTLSNTEALNFSLPENLSDSYEADQTFGPIYMALKGLLTKDPL